MLTAFSSTKNDASESILKNDSKLCVLLDCSLHILNSSRAGLLLCGTCGSDSFSFAKGFSGFLF